MAPSGVLCAMVRSGRSSQPTGAPMAMPSAIEPAIAAARRQAAHLLLEILVAGGALRREFVRVLLEACLYPPAARRDVDTVLLDVGQAWRRAPGDDGEKRHADRERGEREAARPSDFRHAGFRDFRSTV